MPAAGLPWFMAVFGRDSIIMSLQTLPFDPRSSRATTLRVLGARQGVRVDAFRDEEPGKILHESRSGEMTAFAERPHSPYFGSADGDAALPRAPRRVRALDGRRGPRARSSSRRRARRSAGSTSTATASATGTSRTSAARRRASTTSAGRTRGTRSCSATASLSKLPRATLRDPGVRLRREGAVRAPGARVLGRPGVRRSARARGGEPEGALQPRLLDARPRLLRARHRRRHAPGRLDHVEHRPPALERHRRRRQGAGGA